MDDRKALLERKLDELHKKQEQQRREKVIRELTDSTEDFALKYRFADEEEYARTEEFIGHLHFQAPGYIEPSRVTGPVPSDRMYMRFLSGTEELLDICICGHCDDLLKDMENWEMFSPFLLLINEDFESFIHINDKGEMIVSSLSREDSRYTH